MNAYANPTALRIGMTGQFGGIRYRVVGRVVLGVNVEGEIYYWNEFHLVDDTGQSATLVFEEGENGPEWKLFLLFEPAQPMSVAEASRKRVGDLVNLEGKSVPVTLVGQSRVYHIEGQPPEGVEVGDVAHYFNADAGVQMWVVSWTGDEIEFYRGMDVRAEDVAAAFRLPVEQLAASSLAFGEAARPTTSHNAAKFVPLAIMVAVALIAFLGYSKTERKRLPPAPKRLKTPPARLANNASGTVQGRVLYVTGHRVVEIARVGLRYDWHEYALNDGSLLINGLTGDASQWHLLQPARPPAPLTPSEAAALRAGNLLMLDSVGLTVRDLFQAPMIGQFGLLAQSEREWAVVRWTADNIEFYLGRPLAEKEVLATFR